MTSFWRAWITIWCCAVTLFGIALAGAALPGTSGVAYAFLDIVDGARKPVLDNPLRFTLSVLGAVTIGWGLTILAALRAAFALGRERGRPVWVAVATAVSGWYVVDSTLSIAVGYPINAVPNTAFLAAFLWPVCASGVLARDSETRAPA